MILSYNHILKIDLLAILELNNVILVYLINW